MLKLAFRGIPGSSRVNAGEFTIKIQRHRQLLPAEWDRSVKPSMTLIMSIVLKKDLRLLRTFESIEDYLTRKCPLCGTHELRRLSNFDDIIRQIQW